MQGKRNGREIEELACKEKRTERGIEELVCKNEFLIAGVDASFLNCETGLILDNGFLIWSRCFISEL